VPLASRVDPDVERLVVDGDPVDRGSEMFRGPSKLFESPTPGCHNQQPAIRPGVIRPADEESAAHDRGFYLQRLEAP